MMNSNQTPELEEVLAQLTTLNAPPSADALRLWLSRFPQYRHEIIDLVTDWTTIAALDTGEVPSADDVDQIVNRTMSHIQRLMDTPDRLGEIHDLLTDIQLAGFDIGVFEREIGVDRSILTCMAERLIKPSTVPLQLINIVAAALRRTTGAVRHFFLRPPEVAAAYKARRSPKPQQVDFHSLVAHADLSDQQKAKWLAAQPDSELSG
jgi:hypothetical protein